MTSEIFDKGNCILIVNEHVSRQRSVPNYEITEYTSFVLCLHSSIEE